MPGSRDEGHVVDGREPPYVLVSSVDCDHGRPWRLPADAASAARRSRTTWSSRPLDFGRSPARPRSCCRAEYRGLLACGRVQPAPAPVHVRPAAGLRRSSAPGCTALVLVDQRGAVAVRPRPSVAPGAAAVLASTSARTVQPAAVAWCDAAGRSPWRGDRGRSVPVSVSSAGPGVLASVVAGDPPAGAAVVAAALGLAGAVVYPLVRPEPDQRPVVDRFAFGLVFTVALLVWGHVRPRPARSCCGRCATGPSGPRPSRQLRVEQAPVHRARPASPARCTTCSAHRISPDQPARRGAGATAPTSTGRRDRARRPGVIQASAHQALDDLREVLGVLRDDDAERRAPTARSRRSTTCRPGRGVRGRRHAGHPATSACVDASAVPDQRRPRRRTGSCRRG